MKKYNNFLLELKEIENEFGSVGIVFLYEGKVLLVKSVVGHWSYPKGKYEEGETFAQAAIREVKEEINLRLPNDFLNGQKLYKNPIKSLKKIGIKNYYYYIYRLTPEEFEYYFDSKYTINKKNLDQNEVIEAKFFTIKEAKKTIKKKFKDIFSKIEVMELV